MLSINGEEVGLFYTVLFFLVTFVPWGIGVSIILDRLSTAVYRLVKKMFN